MKKRHNIPRARPRLGAIFCWGVSGDEFPRKVQSERCNTGMTVSADKEADRKTMLLLSKADPRERGAIPECYVVVQAGAAPQGYHQRLAMKMTFFP